VNELEYMKKVTHVYIFIHMYVKLERYKREYATVRARNKAEAKSET